MSSRPLVAALMLLAGGATSGCAALGRETLISELEQQTSGRAASAPKTNNPTLLSVTGGAPAGAACRFGSDCLSTVCEHQQCFDMGAPSGGWTVATVDGHQPGLR